MCVGMQTVCAGCAHVPEGSHMMRTSPKSRKGVLSRALEPHSNLAYVDLLKFTVKFCVHGTASMALNKLSEWAYGQKCIQ